ncbi:hypothetical protein IW152_006092, partial [Coemansia sp. BCRC 34962]
MAAHAAPDCVEIGKAITAARYTAQAAFWLHTLVIAAQCVRGTHKFARAVFQADMAALRLEIAATAEGSMARNVSRRVMAHHNASANLAIKVTESSKETSCLVDKLCKEDPDDCLKLQFYVDAAKLAMRRAHQHAKTWEVIAAEQANR